MRKYRLFGIINPIDVLLILLVAMLIWGAYILAQPQTVVAEGGQLIRFTFELGERPEGFHEGIELGIPAFYGGQNWLVGTVVDVFATPFMADAPDERAGIIRRAPVAGVESTHIVIEAWANICDYATSIGNFWVAVNRQVGIRARDFGGMGFITNIEWVES